MPRLSKIQPEVPAMNTAQSQYLMAALYLDPAFSGRTKIFASSQGLFEKKTSTQGKSALQ
jgi:hypothetical protein